MSEPKLPKTQQDLYDAMKRGVICHYMRYMGTFRPNAYYFRTDTHASCTAAVEALVKKGLAERFEVTQFGDHKVRLKP